MQTLLANEKQNDSVFQELEDTLTDDESASFYNQLRERMDKLEEEAAKSTDPNFQKKVDYIVKEIKSYDLEKS